MIAAIETCWKSVEEIQEETESRLGDSKDNPIPVTFGLFGFESPPLPEAKSA